MRNTTIVITLLGLAAMSANAQVHRCKDSAGKTVYSDQPCAADQSGAQIERQRSQSAILKEREQAYEAEVRKQDRRQAEQERSGALPLQGTAGTPSAVATQPVEGWQERKNRENASTSANSIKNNGGKWDAQAAAERGQARRDEAKRQQASQKVFNLSNCNGSVCYDEYGSVYNRNGAFLNRDDGRVCTSQGHQAVCH